MLRLLARLLSPDRCAICDIEGSGLCQDCQLNHLQVRSSSCYLCNARTLQGKVCQYCQRRTPLRRVVTHWRLDEFSEAVVYGVKYDGREDIVRAVAFLLAQRQLPVVDVVTFVPDTSTRRRQRGLVAPQLVARDLARLLSIPCYELLARGTHTPQVGAGRAQRWKQIQGNFKAKNQTLLRNQRILLIDDVVTTGATLTECAKTLKSAGSGTLYGLALART